jgi:beta-fructofuranosidase
MRMMTASAPPRQRKPPRWGWRALGFLTLAVVSLVTAQLQGQHTTGTMGSLIIGILGAAYCSVRGVQAFASLDWTHRGPDPPHQKGRTVLRLADSWAWDFWLIDDDRPGHLRHHLFHLKASRALHDPQRRHLRASIGHCASTDLKNWTVLPDALVHGEPGSFDETATWTGSIVRAAHGEWFLFYTGVTRCGDQVRQQTGLARSTDLETWHRHGDGPVAAADPRWYEMLGDGWPDEHWRDPWVLPDPNGNGWHMLVTARANHGPMDDRGVIGHAQSTDLVTWHVQPPLSQPGSGFGQLEVPQVADVDGQPVLVFSCMPGQLASWHRRTTTDCGTWVLPLQHPVGPFDIRAATPLTGARLYAGKIVHPQPDISALLAFEHETTDMPFDGVIIDPMALAWDGSDVRLSAPTN